ncbi:hypothetical protein [Arthrobacter sp. NPDC056727]|uniref:hypothetical protein n=1 Tax=Arthrobacter sp. NPDC056727 TaxID=3345927 RepID=UPI00366FD2A0
MTYSAAAGRRLPRKTHKSSRRLVGILCVAATVAWVLSVMMGLSVTLQGPPHVIALSIHILALVLAFGAILLVDWHGFLWLIGKRELAETIRLDGAASPLIWSGTAVLLLTGAFLSPNLGNPWTLVKLGAVLVLMLNGIMLIPLMRRLVIKDPTTTFAGLPVGQRIHMLLCLAISQVCWWTAIVVGFVNAEF